MVARDIAESHHTTFEEIRKVNEAGQDFWWARDLQNVLEYGSWDKFSKTIEKAAIACKKAGQEDDNHFFQVGKMVKIGSGAEREISRLLTEASNRSNARSGRELRMGNREWGIYHEGHEGHEGDGKQEKYTSFSS